MKADWRSKIGESKLGKSEIGRRRTKQVSRGIYAPLASPKKIRVNPRNSRQQIVLRSKPSVSKSESNHEEHHHEASSRGVLHNRGVDVPGHPVSRRRERR
jgi:hypothetical protein